MGAPLIRNRHAAGMTSFLHPGDVACAERGDRLETLLGSCIAVILTDPHRTVAAMCHIVYPERSLEPDPMPTASSDAAIDAMYALLMQRGFTPALCEAFVYGGGNMFPELVQACSVGDCNARRVLERLQADGLPITVQEIGGTAYRRLHWVVGDGLPGIAAVEMSIP